MSETLAGLKKKIDGAGELQSVVRTMKALAASSIGQYEKSVLALADYYRAVELGLGACLRAMSPSPEPNAAKGPTGAIVFGSDQGLVGQFNDVVSDFALKSLAGLPGPVQVWAVGERVQARLADAGFQIDKVASVPISVDAITPLVGQIQIEVEAVASQTGLSSVFVYSNRPLAGSLYEPVGQRLLPFDDQWRTDRMGVAWPKPLSPQVLGDPTATLQELIREYLFISLFRACAESLAAENASRLASMQRAEKNITDTLGDLQGKFHRMRQAGIDEELLDVLSGFEALTGRSRHP